MKTILLACLLLCTQFKAKAQLSDSFSDGNTNHPDWVGDDSVFYVNSSFQLQSKATVAGEYALSTAVSMSNTTEWRCWIRNAFSPSTQNFSRFYLMSNNANLKGDLNGYYLQFGGVTGNSDSITFYKQNGLSKTRILGGRAGTCSKNNNLIRIKVIRDFSGNWEIYSDTSGKEKFILEGKANDNEFQTSSYLGYYCRLTSGNSNSFYLDEVYAGSVIKDTISPKVDSVSILNPHKLRIVFSESIDSNSGLSTAGFFIDKQIGFAEKVELVKENVVEITLPSALTNKEWYTLSFYFIQDLAGNKLWKTTFDFLYYAPQPNDILITEIMPDPSPPVDLPEVEFIELYNQTNLNIPLKSWKLTDGTTTGIFPDINIPPHAYMLVTASSNLVYFSGIENSVGIESFPSLNNTGDAIRLLDEKGNQVFALTYNLQSYQNIEKQNGGWSIEMQNPLELCKGIKNYSASSTLAGGSPGKQNAKWSLVPDTISPRILTIRAIDSNHVLVNFTENMDSVSLVNSTIVVKPFVVEFDRSVVNDSLFLNLSNLLPNSIYSFTMQGAKDCNLNALQNMEHVCEYVKPEKANRHDILITEIMPNPNQLTEAGMVEYVELYNRSNRIVSLHGWRIGDSSRNAILTDAVLKPKQMLVVTAKSNKSHFNSEIKTIELEAFISLNKDGDEITLWDDIGNVVHHVSYQLAWYKDKVKQNGGWSLEMVDVNFPCLESANWLASVNSKGGTPGLDNSVKDKRSDLDIPVCLYANPVGKKEIALFFTEVVTKDSAFEIGDIHITPALTIDSIWLYQPTNKSMGIRFQSDFTAATKYQVQVKHVSDCAGNSIMNNYPIYFGTPDSIVGKDLVINEILFNPFTGGEDFVELYNRSDKILDLKDCWLANTDANGEINEYVNLGDKKRLIFPGEYCVLTSNPNQLPSVYRVAHPENMIEIKIPSFNADKGNCVLLQLPGNRLDEFSYSEDLHYQLLEDKKGVSLERIDYNRPASDITNWTSASSVSGFATPTKQNSQFMGKASTEDYIQIQPPVFSPDNDGYNDIVNFNFSNAVSGLTASLVIYNMEGLPIKHILQNQLLGTNGTISWDGITDEGRKTPIGIYIAFFECYDLKGYLQRVKKSFVVAGKF